MLNRFALCLFACISLFPLLADGGSFYSDGSVDNSSGAPSKDLVFKDFEITPDGFIKGYIINTSNAALGSVKLDAWTTNRAETRIFWRKTLDLGTMAPKASREVKEAYSPMPDDPSSIVFKFRLPSSANFRNAKGKE